eukprot:IDg15913t1
MRANALEEGLAVVDSGNLIPVVCERRLGRYAQFAVGT